MDLFLINSTPKWFVSTGGRGKDWILQKKLDAEEEHIGKDLRFRGL